MDTLVIGETSGDYRDWGRPVATLEAREDSRDSWMLWRPRKDSIMILTN